MTPEPSSILTVSQLNRHVRTQLEYEFNDIWVEGELSNVSKPSSGHCYFSLKDESTQLRCVYFRNHQVKNTHTPLKEGLVVLVRGTLSLYEARGDFQLIVTELRKSGLGALHQAFEQLKDKLAAQGLFEQQRKKPLPTFPHTIGIISSSTGAALQDVLTTLKRRFPLSSVVVYACDVQGKHASNQLIKAVSQANHDKRCQVLIMARGGGSFEDLWPFNDEQLVHTIANSHIPIITGIGHETDFTIADFVADLRSATPTAAAEAATPDKHSVHAHITGLVMQLNKSMRAKIHHKKTSFNHLTDKITSPQRLILTHWQTLDYHHQLLMRTINHSLSKRTHSLHQELNRLRMSNPMIRLERINMQLNSLVKQLQYKITLQLSTRQQQFHALLTTLHAVSPLATLDRGYALVTHQSTVIHNSQQLQPGDVVNTRLAQGTFNSKIIDKTS